MIKKLIDRSALVIFFILTVGILLVQTSATARDLLIEIDENKLFEHVNNYRRENDLPLFTKSKKSCELASFRLKRVATDFSHDGFSVLAKNENLHEFELVGENLARFGIDTFNEQEMMSAWVKSPLHNKNLVNPVFTDSCIKCSGGTCVHIFGGY